MTNTTEKVFEDIIEESILDSGFIKGDARDFNRDYAIDEKRLWHFLEATQEDELEKLKRDSNYKIKVLDRLDKLIKKYGVLRLLKKGFSVEDANFVLMYEMPLNSSSELVKKRFLQNEFSITRQIITSYNQKPDITLFVNGLPIVTIELKKISQNQTAKNHGIKQYKQRDTKDKLYNFARCLVHFTLDEDEVYMTTKLNKRDTFFLPFNKGHDFGAGNPPNPNGFKSDYLYKEILTPNSLSEIIKHFIRLDGKESDRLSNRTLFFPRYHQLDVVRKIVADTEQNGVGKSYLIQHSAGSGKSNSITWSAYRLIEVYTKDSQTPLFNSVVVVTDRRLLDKQIKDNIKDFSEIKNIVAHANSAKDLKVYLESGKKIIITTIQKFPYIVDGIANLSDKNFAVIIDEAHSSQSGSSAENLNRAMGIDEEIDIQDKIIEIIKQRKMKKNVSYFAFTATPKNSTLEKFGVKQDDGSFKPFHLYSMKQAIEEGFILDVLANYTTYRSYYQIQKSIEDNPLFDTKKAQKRLKSFVEKNPKTIQAKADIMLEHFVNKVFKTKKLKGNAKAMVVTSDIQSAILYYFAIKKSLKEFNNPFKVIIAFSGKKEIDGVEYTEDSLNGFASKDIATKFDSSEYRLLVVANKFLTGFDQPKLCTMYIDKKLQGVLAVQTLSRLNRSAPKFGKKTEDLFVLDFYNSVDDIKKSFDPFYTSTTLSSATDVNVLHDLKSALDSFGAYEKDEVEEFIEKYFNNNPIDELEPIINLAIDRFEEFDDEEKADFKIKAKQFVKIYAQVVSIIPYEVESWERLFWFLKFLIPKLKIKDKEKDLIDNLLESVDLSTYGLERVRLNETIELDEQESKIEPQNSNPRGAHGNENRDLLEEIIKDFNKRWFEGWNETPEEQKVRFLKIANKIKSHPDFEEKYLNNSDKYTRKLAYQKIFDEVMGEQRRTELELYKKIATDELFKEAMQEMIQNII
ncbi:MAG: type I restriction endonuclease subunit R [Epsilonproteobacteria bacterium]|nr:type I restriction endonuclease subunit R [Campylobacterota bacterium]